MKREEINESIAFIQDGDEFFQILNENKDDWDESATATLYQEFKTQHL